MNMHELLDVLSLVYLPSLRYFRGKNAMFAPMLRVEDYPVVLGCDNIGAVVQTDSELYHTLLDFHDQCKHRDGYNWIMDTVGLNLHFYQLLRLRYWLLRSVQDYKRVNNALPEDTIHYSIRVLTSGFPEDECRSRV